MNWSVSQVVSQSIDTLVTVGQFVSSSDCQLYVWWKCLKAAGRLTAGTDCALAITPAPQRCLAWSTWDIESMSWLSPSCFKSHPYRLGKPLVGLECRNCFPDQSDSIRAICFVLLFCRLMPVVLPHQVIPLSETPAFPARVACACHVIFSRASVCTVFGMPRSFSDRIFS